MPNYKLIIGFLAIFVITKMTTERYNYTRKQRIINLFMLILGFIILYIIYKYRNENHNLILGVLPNFLTGLFYPSLLVVSKFRVKNILNQEEFSWIFFTVFIWTIYETMLIFAGRQFDLFDIIATLIGAILSVPILLFFTTSKQEETKGF